MKTRNIILLLGVAGLMAVMVYSFSSNLSQYTDFATARKSGREAHVVGTWVRRSEARYDPNQDVFSFYLMDSLKQEQLVHYPDPKPANFEQVDKVVVIGKYQGDVFVTNPNGILLKCPSKYTPNSLPQELPAAHTEPKKTIRS